MVGVNEIQRKARRLYALSPDERIRLMKFLLKPIGFVPLKRKRSLRYKREKGTQRFPAIWANDLRRVAKEFGCDLVFGDYDASGYSDHYTRTTNGKISHRINRPIICLNMFFFERERGLQEVVVSFCHELAHRIQNLFYGSRFFMRTFNEELVYEKEAGRLSYFIYKAYFLHRFKIKHASFRVCCSSEVIDWFRSFVNKRNKKRRMAK